MIIKRRLIPILVGALIIIVAFVVGQNIDFLIGSFWHLTNPPEVSYGNVTINVPHGWYPLMRKGSLGLVKYPKDGTVITFTSEMAQIPSNPKEAMESIGRVFEGAEKVSINGSEGVRIRGNRVKSWPLLFDKTALSICSSGPLSDGRRWSIMRP